MSPRPGQGALLCLYCLGSLAGAHRRHQSGRVHRAGRGKGAHNSPSVSVSGLAGAAAWFTMIPGCQLAHPSARDHEGEAAAESPPLSTGDCGLQAKGPPDLPSRSLAPSPLNSSPLGNFSPAPHSAPFLGLSQQTWVVLGVICYFLGHQRGSWQLGFMVQDCLSPLPHPEPGQRDERH